MRSKLDFAIVGVQKAATTALDTYLRRHDRIQMAAVKETHFFSNDERNWARATYRELHGYFDWSRRDLVRGEATPIYIYWPDSLERLLAYNRAIKLIISLRHPSMRAFSHWRMEAARGLEPAAFSEAIRSGRMRAQSAHRVFSYVERGFYAPQIERLLSLFPRENVLFLKADDLWNAPTRELNRICDFLGVPPFEHVRQEYIVPLKAQDGGGKLLARDREYLDELFRPDIAASAARTGLDLSNWLRPDYEEPMRAP